MEKFLSFSLLLLSLNACFKTAEQLEQDKSSKTNAESEDAKFMKNANSAADLEEAKIQIQRLNGANGDLQLKVEELKKENEALKSRVGSMEETFHKFSESTQKNMADVIADIALLDERTAGETKKPKKKEPAESKKKSDQSTTEIKGEVPATKALSPVDEARNLIKEKKYKEAVAILEEPLKGKSKYKDQILYFHGEALYKQKEYKQAILSFDEVVQKHKESNKWTKSVERVADSFEKLGLKDEAKSYRSLLNKK